MRPDPHRAGTALITGASSGIGRELSIVFARNGYNLVLVARREDRMQLLSDELAAQHGVSVRLLAADLARPSAAEEVMAELRRGSIRVDVLVNNAGFGSFGPFAETDLRTELDLLQVNIASLTHLTKLCLRDMIRNGGGKILNVASTAAFQPGPLMAVYFASKAYVLWFTEALASELDGTAVTVSALCPGPTRTEFQAHAAIAPSSSHPLSVMEASTVAESGYRGLMAGRRIIIPGILNSIAAQGHRVLPRSAVTRILRAVQERRRRLGILPTKDAPDDTDG